MNTFYHFEGNVYETQAEVINATKNYSCKKYDEIETEKSFADFEDAYLKSREEGDSIIDSIEWAK